MSQQKWRVRISGERSTSPTWMMGSIVLRRFFLRSSGVEELRSSDK
jgi:hypothetical protein